MTVATPKQLGFIMGAEWEKHSDVWLAWPHDETTFPKRIPKAETVFVKIIKTIYESETVKLLVTDEVMKKHVTDMLHKSDVDIKKIDFIITKFADVWTRDYGPIFLVNRSQKSLAWTKWKYNAYGKGEIPFFAPLLIDNDVFNNIDFSLTKFEPKIIMEGGSVEVNGQGTLITTEQCLLNENRNPNLNKPKIERYLNDYFGTSNIIWLSKGLINDHTDGHIDDVARFVSPNKILTAYEDDPKDENYKILDENYKVLISAKDQHGKSFEILKLPMPHMHYDDGQKAPVSYANFYIGNTVVLVPIFQDPNDEKALKIIQSCFPDRKVVGIDCRETIYGGGSIHCMTQQQPVV
jgi:agmatine deiminase